VATNPKPQKKLPPTEELNKYLLDTNVVSELHKPRPHGAVVAWVSD
jgi:hypothetical protein